MIRIFLALFLLIPLPARAQEVSISASGPVPMAVLGILIIMSILTWVIVALKYKHYAAVTREDEAFDAAFWKTTDRAQLAQMAKRHEESALAAMFIATEEDARRGFEIAPAMDAEQRASLTERILSASIESEVLHAERFVPFLATTASSAPFIGLFGTVWGIMDAFGDIGAAGSASLSVVAPGISEALIATAAGLASAIPAAIFYNVFQGKSERLRDRMRRFAAEMLNVYEASWSRKGDGV